MNPERTALKTELLHRIREQVQAQLMALSTMISASRDEATSDQSRPENKYDTRALEASYLAAGQGERLAALKQLSGWLQIVPNEPKGVVAPGCFIELEDGQWLLLAPQGGHEVQCGSRTVRLISAASPLGRVIRGAEPGDVCDYETPAGQRELEVLGVL